MVEAAEKINRDFLLRGPAADAVPIPKRLMKTNAVSGMPELTFYGGFVWRRYPHYPGRTNRYFGRTSGKDKLLLHRQIWQDVHGPIPHGFIVHHKDEDKTNNSVDNLELKEKGAHTRHHCLGKRPASALLWKVNCHACGESVEKWSNIPVKYCDHLCKKRALRKKWKQQRT